MRIKRSVGIRRYHKSRGRDVQKITETQGETDETDQEQDRCGIYFIGLLHSHSFLLDMD